VAYAALSTIQTIATGQPFLAATLQQANDSLEFLIDPPACSLKESSTQSIADSTYVALTSNEENFDNDSMHSTVSNTSRITIQTAGRYLITATVYFTVNSTGARVLRLVTNGTSSTDMVAVGASAGGPTILPFAKPLVLSAGDYVEVHASQNSGGALDVQMVDFSAYFLTR
jgi:hypothetical protein